MAVNKTYKCDLCGDALTTDPGAESRKAIGLHFTPWPRGWLVKRAGECAHHICPPCVASIQAMPQMCGQGYECNGGPNCGSDHK